MIRNGVVSDERLDALIDVLGRLRHGEARTRPALGSALGLGRAVVAQRVSQLLDWGLVEEADLAPSTGGRSARELRLRTGAATILVANLNAGRITAGLSDLDGQLLVSHAESARIADGPVATLSQLAGVFDRILSARPPEGPPVWAIGIGVPGPVDFRSGRPIAPPIMPGWDRFPVRQWLADRYGVPVWVDNDVNLMMLGELRAGLARDERDVVLVKASAGIGAALVSAGRLHRGAKGVAGDIGHTVVVDDPSVACRCGRTGCLEALAGGDALGGQATAAAREGRSPLLVDRMAGRSELDAQDVLWAAAHGDPVAVGLLAASSRLVGTALADVINFFNPSLVVIGGGLPEAGDFYLASVRQAVLARALPLATRDLRIERSALGSDAGLIGAAYLATDELFSKACLPLWVHHGSPEGLPHLADLSLDHS